MYLREILVGKRLCIINGPNLNLLGKRQPEIYGHTTIYELERNCVNLSQTLGLEAKCYQTNSESQIIELIHAARGSTLGIIINAAGYSHTSIAILDALNTYEGIVVEVHISDIYKREKFRHFSFINQRANKSIIGEGVDGYLTAIKFVSANVGS